MKYIFNDKVSTLSTDCRNIYSRTVYSRVTLICFWQLKLETYLYYGPVKGQSTTLLISVVNVWQKWVLECFLLIFRKLWHDSIFVVFVLDTFHNLAQINFLTVVWTESRTASAGNTFQYQEGQKTKFSLLKNLKKYAKTAIRLLNH